MRVLITGASGNIGQNAIHELMKKKHQVRCYIRRSDKNVKFAKSLRKKYGKRIDFYFGDIRDEKIFSQAVVGQDVVVHLAYIIPPLSERNVDLAEKVNIDGTNMVLNVLKKLKKKPKLIFTSSVVVYGDTQWNKPPRKVNDKLIAANNYGLHKIVCEKLIKKSGLKWCIFRVGASMSVSLDQIDPIMFDIPLKTRMEYVHTKDVGFAIANAVGCGNVWGKVLHLGGGEKCQLYYGEIIGRAMESIGLGKLPFKAFGNDPFYTDWMDTKESQKLLKFQRYTYDDYLHELVQEVGWRKFLIRILRPIIRIWLLRKSVYFKK
ncbi:NAD-dependent epimerase/dehydratase family protein [Nanoarchaeota archaeon]